jgi:large subunit ribosomal protein L30
VTLTKSPAGASDTQVRTLEGLGLWKFGQERTLKDTPSIRGMVFKVKHLVSQAEVAGDVPARKRQKPRRARLAAAARAKAAGQKAEKSAPSKK